MSSIKKILYTTIVSLFIGIQPLATKFVYAAAEADWTVMVYMNAKNNLEQFGINNFHQMAAEGSSEKVNVLVEMGRPKNHYYTGDENWSGVMRFRVLKGMKPLPSSALQDLGNADMGSSSTLRKFLDWSVEKYPAKRYLLIIWNHGQGWRQMYVKDRQLKSRLLNREATAQDLQELDQLSSSAPYAGMYRSVSYDEDSKNTLYNREIQEVLETFAKNGPRMDVVAYDACLMGMLETAYSLRNSADIMVGSQELVPGEGSPYDKWLPRLIATPSMDSRSLGKLLVDTYKERYSNTYMTTFSALDLSKIEQASKDLTQFSTALRERLSTEKSTVALARSKILGYADWERPPLGFSIDLILFLDSFRDTTKDEQLKNLAKTARDALQSSVVNNYASDRIQDRYGSNGIAIYFPKTLAEFHRDPNSGGYLPKNSLHPVEFVQKEQWAPFLLEYLGVDVNTIPKRTKNK